MALFFQYPRPLLLLVTFCHIGLKKMEELPFSLADQGVKWYRDIIIRNLTYGSKVFVDELYYDQS